MTVKVSETGPVRGVFYISLGCSKNLYDTETVSGFLREAGFLPVKDPVSYTHLTLPTN